jgi:hypothetical protein
MFWEVVDLERGPLNLLSINEELFGRKSSDSGLENWEYGRRDPLYWPRNTFYPQKLALTLPTGGGRSVGIVRSLTMGHGEILQLCSTYFCLFNVNINSVEFLLSWLTLEPVQVFPLNLTLWTFIKISGRFSFGWNAYWSDNYLKWIHTS